MDEDLELIARNIEVPAPSIQESSTAATTDFSARRFYALSASHNSAVLIGSSFAHQHTSHASERVLDAAATSFVQDGKGVVIGVRQATADGLGGSYTDPVDHLENESIAKVSAFACEKLIKSTSTAKDTYIEIAQQSAAQALQKSSRQKYESTCAMASAKFNYAGEGKYHGELANMGDTLILVLDKNFQQKGLLPARVVYRGFGSWSPPSVQEITKEQWQNNFTNIELDLAEGDFIISMTDGVWNELPLLDEVSNKEFIDLAINPAAVDASAKIDAASHFPAYQYSMKVLTQALDNSLQKRKELLELFKEIRTLDHDTDKTVSQILSRFRDTDRVEVADKLEHLLFDKNGGDGISYNKGVEIPISLVMDDLKNRTAGDCSTINIVRLPYHLDELLRAFIKYPKNRGRILEDLMPYLSSATALQGAIARLKQEETLCESSQVFAALKTRPVFHEWMLNDLQALLVHYKSLADLLRAAKYSERIQAVTDYLATVDGAIQSYLVDLLKTKLSPPKCFLNFVYPAHKEIFTNFIRRFGAGQVFSAAHYPDIQLEDSLSFSC